MPRKPKQVERSRTLRQQDVPAETVLWHAIRNRALSGFKFRRQHPVGSFFVDFACVECKIVVEIDGESHLNRKQEDGERTLVIESEGWLVLRFWNTDIYDDLVAVKQSIFQECTRRAAKV